VNKRVGWFLAVTITAWAFAAYPAQVLGGDTALVYSATAAALCILPTTATILWATWAYRQAPDQQVIMILGGTGMRMGVVLGVGLLLNTMVPYFSGQGFWVWLLIFYLLTLAVEVLLVVKDRSAISDARSAAPDPASLSKNV
jgi:hypothetical protein